MQEKTVFSCVCLFMYEIRNNTLIKYHGNREVVSIPGGVETIGRCAFEGCTSIVRVVIGDHVRTINDFAFMGCTSLTSIVIPSSVTTIGEWVFDYCTSFTTVYYTGSEEDWAKISINSDNEVLLGATVVYNYQG